jgi:hypothetical protein
LDPRVKPEDHVLCGCTNYLAFSLFLGSATLTVLH